MDETQIHLYQALEQAKFIDLSSTYTNDMRGFNARVTVQSDGLNAHSYEIYSHAGTHIDAPYHYGVNNRTIEDISLNRLIGKAWIVRIKGIRPKGLIRIDHLGPIAKQVQKGDSIIIQTGWSNYLGKAKYRDQMPRISRELAQWMVKKSIKMLGVEPPSVADIRNMDETTLIHHILLGGNVVIIEGLTNLEEIQSDQIWLIALPLKIQNGDGAPARVIALEI